MAAVGLPVWTPGVWADTVWAAGVWESTSTPSGGAVWASLNGVTTAPSNAVQGTQANWLWTNGAPIIPAHGRRPAWPRRREGL